MFIDATLRYELALVLAVQWRLAVSGVGPLRLSPLFSSGERTAQSVSALTFTGVSLSVPLQSCFSTNVCCLPHRPPRESKQHSAVIREAVGSINHGRLSGNRHSTIEQNNSSAHVRLFCLFVSCVSCACACACPSPSALQSSGVVLSCLMTP